jgi:hypothetical protein
MVKYLSGKMSKQGEQMLEYPLKIIDMDSFLSHKSDLAWKSVLAPSKNTNNIEDLKYTTDDQPNKINKLYKQILFTDCEQLKKKFEKTYCDYNIQCLNSSISISTIDEAKNLLNMLTNSKRWLFHGSLKYEMIQAGEQNASTQARTRKRSDSFKINQINRHLNDSTSK